MKTFGVREAVHVMLVLALFCAGGVQAEAVDDFTLLDQNGLAHQLYYHSDAPAVVLFVQGNGCPMVRNVLPDFKAVRDRFESQGVVFLMLNANLQDTRASIAKEAGEWAIDFAVMKDETRVIATALGVDRTAEVFVINPADGWKVVYRGAVNDRLTYERQKKTAKEHYLADALRQTLAGKKVAVAHVEPRGCIVNLEEDEAIASYTDHIAPMLQKNCVECHRSGGIGPWAMTSYDMVKGFAPMIREVIRTRRMPPWHADPDVGHWENDKRLPAADARTLVRWVGAGAPRGKGKDPLLEVRPLEAEWPLGKPDLIVSVPAFDIPASGVVDYQFPAVANPLDKDVWVRAITVLPGEMEVVHHVLVGAGDNLTEGASVFENYLGGYAPGSGSTIMPEGTGVLLKAGQYFQFQLHYTPFGRAVTDKTRLGLYFHDKKPKNFLRHEVVMNPTLQIPANAAAHPEKAYFEFYKDAVLYTILPHSHYRGKSSTFALRYPDGEEKLLLSVPNYDFNWQRGYVFETPLDVPAGSRLVHTTVFDNSRQNPANPDPDRAVGWGLQSWDEMLYGDFVFRWVEESTETPIHDGVRMQMTQQVGFIDRDMDGKITPEEVALLGPRQVKRLEASFQFGDQNQDGALTVDEMVAVRKMLQQRRRNASAGGL